MKDSIRNASVDRMYEQTLGEAPQSATNIAFFAKTCGDDRVLELPFNEEGLAEVETIYRRLCARDGFTADMNRGMLEDLMAYFLGETLVRNQHAVWYAYKGRYSTIKPVVIRFPDRGQAVDVSGFCRDLIAKDVLGARHGRSLLAFYKKAKSTAFLPAPSLD